MFPIWPVSSQMNRLLSVCFVLCIYSNHGWRSLAQVFMLQSRDTVKEDGTLCQRQNKHRSSTVLIYAPKYFPFTQADSLTFSFQVFSFVSRQMGALSHQKGALWSHRSRATLWGIWVVVVMGGRAGACQICCLLLRLIWRGAQGLIKAQVKSLIELSFRLISLLPLPGKRLWTLHSERRRATSSRAGVFHSAWQPA